MNKASTRFHTKKAQKPYPLGRHIPIWLISIGEYPPPLPGWRRAMSTVFSGLCFKSLVSRRAVTKGRESVISSGYCEYDCRVLLQYTKRKQDQKNFQAVEFIAFYLPGNFTKILVIALLKRISVLGLSTRTHKSANIILSTRIVCNFCARFSDFIL